jgi:hypothetical protein
MFDNILQTLYQINNSMASTYIMTKGGYPQSGNGQNQSCFSNLTVEQAQQQCDGLGDRCAGFSIAADSSGNGCFKSDTNGGIVYDSSYNGYTKSSQTFTTNQNDRDLKASVCKSTPNGLNNITGEINNCTSTTEIKRNTNFAANTVKLQQDINALSATTMDSLIMGDTMFGQFGYSDIAKQVQARNEELKEKKIKLFKEVENNEAIIERSNRDFVDEKDSISEPQPKRFVRFIEDYTLAILSISYLFMIISIIYVYTLTSELKLIGFLKAIVGSILLSMFLFMMLFFLS